MHDGRPLLTGAVLLFLLATGFAQEAAAQMIPFGLDGKQITHLAAEQGDPDGQWFPGTANMLFAATAEDSVFMARTRERGEDWTSITSPLASMPGITALGVQHWGYGPRDGLWLLAALRPHHDAAHDPLMLRREFYAFGQASEDWIPADSGLERESSAPVIHAITATYFSGHTPPQPVIAGTSTGIFRGYPGGSYWEAVGDSMWSVRDIAVTPHWFGSGFRAVGTLPSAVNALFSSTDGGQTWTAEPIAFSAIDSVRHVALAPGHPDTVYVAAGASILRSTDGGAIWERTMVINSGAITALATDPLQPAHIYAAASASESAALFRSSDLGAQWQVVPLPREVTAAGITCMTVALLDSIPMSRLPRRGLFFGTAGAGVWMYDLDAEPASAENIGIPETAKLDIYPQPAGGRCSLALTLAKPQKEVDVAVYDLLGRCVIRRAFGPRSGGSHLLPLSVAGLSPGIYLARVILPGRAVSTPLVIRR